MDCRQQRFEEKGCVMYKRILLRGFVLLFVVALLGYEAQGETTNHVITQYWTWWFGGSTWDWEIINDYGGWPLVGDYLSSDRNVAAEHIDQMLQCGIDVISPGFINQAGDETGWCDEDQALQDGVMKASNFRDIEFCITYDLATRGGLVHEMENGHHWRYPNGKDVLPGVLFYDPQIEAVGGWGWPSYDFSLQDPNSDNKYIYDELLSYDFKYFAEKYFNLPNYLKINGQCVVLIYDSWRFNNGGQGQITDGFKRAFKRIREELYDDYGIKVYLAGHFATYYNNGNYGGPNSSYYKNNGFFQCYDAVGSFNVVDYHYFLDHPNGSLATHSSISESVQNNYRASAQSSTRTYRSGLKSNVQTAYGSADAAVDYMPLLSFSFCSDASGWNFWSSATDLSQVTGECSMVEGLRNNSTCAEEDTAFVYNVAFNQWVEGQVIEVTETDNPAAPYPGEYAWRYLDQICKTLSEENYALANGSFERGSGADASFWTENTPSQVVRCDDDAKSGDYSLKIHDAGGGGWVWYLASQSIERRHLPGGTTITASAYMKGAIDSGEAAALKMLFYDDNDTLLDSKAVYYGPGSLGSQWSCGVCSYEVPADELVSRVDVQLMYGMNKNGSGYVYWDDVDLTIERNELVGDLNGDYRVDFEDFAILAANWLEEAE
jgi:hypothetical protein